MKTQIKKILATLCAAVVLVSTLAGCAQFTTKKMTLQEVYESSDEVRKSFDNDIANFKREYSDSYSDAKIEISGNSISYIFTFKETMPIAYQGLFVAALGNTLEIQCQTQVYSVRKNATYLTDEPLSMSYIIKNPDGTEFYTYTYTEPQN